MDNKFGNLILIIVQQDVTVFSSLHYYIMLDNYWIWFTLHGPMNINFGKYEHGFIYAPKVEYGLQCTDF